MAHTFTCTVDGYKIENNATSLIECIDIGLDYIENVEVENINETVWFEMVVKEIDENGETIREESHTVPRDPPEPKCLSGKEHDWCSPYDLVGGLKENPGVWGHGGGVIEKDICRHCGAYRTVDTFAQNPVTGEQGLTSVTYGFPDDWSMVWIAEQILEDKEIDCKRLVDKNGHPYLLADVGEDHPDVEDWEEPISISDLEVATGVDGGRGYYLSIEKPGTIRISY
jgi:hypothetical protein